ncbi:MAG: hypothetical protein ABFD25_03125 [Clostridiaceae bacterium]
MNVDKGFLTIAFGKYYYYLAANLVMSYRYRVPKDKQLPFVIVTDVDNDKTALFDVVIVKKPSKAGFINKLNIAEYSPFEETIFIDADCLVYGDITSFFTSFEENGSPVSSFGGSADINRKVVKFFDLEKTKMLGLTYVPTFNAAVYYCKKPTGTEVLKTAVRFYNDPTDYGYLFHGDEPYVAIAMSYHGCKCASHLGSIGAIYYGSDIKIIKLDIVNGIDSVIVRGEEKDAPLFHWSTYRTHRPKYRYEVVRLRYAFEGKKLTCLVILKPFIYLKCWASVGILFMKAIIRSIKHKFSAMFRRAD